MPGSSNCVPCGGWMAYCDVSKKIDNVRGSVSMHIHPRFSRVGFAVSARVRAAGFRMKLRYKKFALDLSTRFSCKASKEIAKAVVPDFEPTVDAAIDCVVTIRVGAFITAAAIWSEILAIRTPTTFDAQAPLDQCSPFLVVKMGLRCVHWGHQAAACSWPPGAAQAGSVSL